MSKPDVTTYYTDYEPDGDESAQLNVESHYSEYSSDSESDEDESSARVEDCGSSSDHRPDWDVKRDFNRTSHAKPDTKTFHIDYEPRAIESSAIIEGRRSFSDHDPNRDENSDMDMDCTD